MKYLLDSNVFIEAKNRYYAFDICPGFWDWMDHITTRSVGSIDMVRDELCRYSDELADWMDARKSAPWVLPVDDEPTQVCFGDVAAAIQAGKWKDAAKARFLSGADPWLVAKAKVLKSTVVTHEVPAPLAVARISLADVCIAFRVPYINTFDVLRTVSATFDFSPPK